MDPRNIYAMQDRSHPPKVGFGGGSNPDGDTTVPTAFNV